ncbi:MAG: MarR family winged helix-turn-helix transcriptional regulator [Acidobacteriota bacterium]
MTPREGTRRAPDRDRVLRFLQLLWSIDHELQRASKRMLRQLGVTGPQRLALRLIGRYPDSTPQEIADALCLHKSTVTGILQRLQGQGLIQRSVDARDKRRSRLRVTASGRRLSEATTVTIEHAVGRALARVEPQALAGVRDVLTAVAESLRAGANRERQIPSASSSISGNQNARNLVASHGS